MTKQTQSTPRAQSAQSTPPVQSAQSTQQTPSKAVKSLVMDAAEIDRAMTRIAHQILEANHGAQSIALVGIVTRGDLLAKTLASKIAQIEGVEVPLGKLDISFYRDDFATYFNPEVHSTSIDFSIDGKTIVLVDDVLFTGRTIRAALDALMDIGRPSCVQLAVLVDRGHRELPIRADYVGKNVPSSSNESVRLFLEETDGHSAVEILELAPGAHNGAAPLPKTAPAAATPAAVAPAATAAATTPATPAPAAAAPATPAPAAAPTAVAPAATTPAAAAPAPATPKEGA